VEEASQEGTSAREAAPGETEHPAQRAVPLRTEIAHHRAFEPRPGTLDWIELRGVGGQAKHRQPMRLALDEFARGQAAVRVDAIPDHNERSRVMLVKAREEADDVFRADRSGHQAEKEASSASVRRVGHRSDR